jgi:hypothetical protein
MIGIGKSCYRVLYRFSRCFIGNVKPDIETGLLIDVVRLSRLATRFFSWSVLVDDWTREDLSISFDVTRNLTDGSADLASRSWPCFWEKMVLDFPLIFNDNYEWMRRVVRPLPWNCFPAFNLVSKCILETDLEHRLGKMLSVSMRRWTWGVALFTLSLAGGNSAGQFEVVNDLEDLPDTGFCQIISWTGSYCYQG